MTHEELELSVGDELFWDPKVDSAAFAVSAEDPDVTLRGTVSSWYEHDAVVTATWAAPGVIDVDDRLVVEYRARIHRSIGEARHTQ